MEGPFLPGVDALRILYAGHFTYPFETASATRIRLLADGLVAAGAEVMVAPTTVVAPRMEDATADGEYRYRGVRYEPVFLERVADAGLAARASLVLREMRYSKVRLTELVREFGADVVVMYATDSIYASPIRHAARACDVPLVSDVVEWFSSFSWRGGWLHYRALSHVWYMRVQNWRVDGLIGISRYLCDYYDKGRMPVLRMPTPSNIHAFTPSPREASPEEVFRLGYYGTWSPKDGFIEMLHAMKLLNERQRRVELWAAGSPVKKHYMRRIEDFLRENPQLEDAVKLLGRLPQEELPETFQACDAMILSRPRKRFALAGLPQKVPEYMAMERPIIVTDVGDIPEYVRNGIEGLVVPPDSPVAVADAVEELMDLPDRGMEMGRAARSRASEVFDSRMLAERLLAFLEKVLAQYRRRG
jgi:glycosyltransferase involved in cell wall biosynthesis